MALLGLAAAALWRQRAQYLIWLVCMALAVTGLVIVDVYRHSLGDMIRAQGRKILMADVTISARRRLSPEEIATFRSALPAGAKFSEMTEMMAMVAASSGGSRLCQVRFVDQRFPLAGELRIEGPAQKIGVDNSVWVDSDLLALLPTELGQKIKIGGRDFLIGGIVRKDSSQTFRFGGLGPRVYIDLQKLEETKLIQFGSTFFQTVLATLPKPLTAEQRRQIENLFKDPAVQITVPADIEQGPLRVLSRLMDFLGLIGMVTLMLGWIGVYYLGRRWLTLERPSAALLKAVGLSNAELLALLALKLLLILTAAAVVGGWLSWFGAQAAYPLFRSALPAEFALRWSWPNTILILAAGPLAGLLLLFEPLRQTAMERPLVLLHPESAPSNSPSGRRWLSVFASVLLVSALVFLQARSWRVSALFITSVALCLVTLRGATTALLRGLNRKETDNTGWLWHLARAQWLARPATTLLLVTVSALAGLLAQLVPHLQQTLVGELNTPARGERPALFLFDVQDEQRQPLIDFLRAKGVEVSQQSPFIRARIMKINGNDFERAPSAGHATREEELEARFRNRGVNLTYRQQLSPHEKIIEGKSWEQTASNEISVEKDYAKRLRLKLGDAVLFDIQGTEVPATVASLREVHWDSFEPAFFMQFTDGPLNDAPKTWVITLRQSAAASAAQVQRWITEQFPNVSSVHVAETVENIIGLIGKLSFGLQVASLLTMVLGLFVFLMVLIYQLSSARQDFLQLRLLGLAAQDIGRLNLLAYGGLALAGAMFGGALSLAVGWGLARFAFETTPTFDLQTMFTVGLVICGFSAIGILAASRKVSR